MVPVWNQRQQTQKAAENDVSMSASLRDIVYNTRHAARYMYPQHIA